MAIKGQALAYFIPEFPYVNTTKVAGTTNDVEATKVVEMGNDETPMIGHEDTYQWILYLDSASNENESRAGMMLISPEGYKIHYTYVSGSRRRIMRPNMRPS